MRMKGKGGGRPPRPATGAQRGAAREVRGVRGVRAGVCAALLALGCGGEPRATSDSAGPDPAHATPLAVALDSGPPAPVAATATAPVTAFLRFVDAQRADSAGDAGALAVDGLRLLAAAIEAVAPPDTLAAAEGMPARVATLRARADSMARDSLPVDRSRQAGAAFALASAMLQTLQDRGRPALTDRGAEVRQAAAALRADHPLADQAELVRRFFDRAAAVLRGLDATPPAAG